MPGVVVVVAVAAVGVAQGRRAGLTSSPGTACSLGCSDRRTTYESIRCDEIERVSFRLKSGWLCIMHRGQLMLEKRC